jgi:isoamylase
VLNRAIMIAEAWDIATYQVGNFPVDWSEWNGKFRDTMRRFGKGDTAQEVL